MSGTTKTINDASEQEALALLTENAVQMEKIIENQLANNWKRIYNVCIALEHMGNHSVDEVVSFLQDASTEAYDMLLLSGDGSFLDRSSQQGKKQITKDLLPLMQGEDGILLLRQEKIRIFLHLGKG